MLEFLTLTVARAKFHSARSDSPIVRGLVIQKASMLMYHEVEFYFFIYELVKGASIQ